MKYLMVEVSTTKSVPYRKETIQYKQLVNATAGYICEGLQAANIVGESSFKNLLSLESPRFVLPHRTYLSEKVLPEKYLAVGASIEHKLAALECKCPSHVTSGHPKSSKDHICH